MCSGGVQAVATGAILARLSDEDGRFTYNDAAIAAIATGFAAGVFYAFNLGGPAFAAISCVSAVGASVALRWLYRGSFAAPSGMNKDLPDQD